MRETIQITYRQEDDFGNSRGVPLARLDIDAKSGRQTATIQTDESIVGYHARNLRRALYMACKTVLHDMEDIVFEEES